MLRTLVPEIPILHRSLAALVAAWLAVAATAAAAAPLSEADVIRLAAAAHPDVALAREEAAAARARVGDSALHPNPSLAWEREHFPSAGGAREDAFILSVPVDASGRRSARTRLSRSEANASAAQALRTRSRALLEALETFYAALAADARVAVERRSVERLEEFVRVLGRRQAEGTVSGHELVRLELELELARSSLGRARAEADALRIELMLLLELEQPPSELRADEATHTGELEPSRKTPASLVALRAAEREAHAALDSAGSAWVPEVTLQGGLKIVETTTTEYGYVAGVALDVPLFSRGQDVSAVARAEARLAETRRRSLERAARARLTLAAQRFEKAREQLVRFEAGTRERRERLERAAASSYREGTSTLTELLDAERALLAIELRRGELAAELRRAELALREARGEFE